MICSNCNNPLSPDAHFCSRCGAATPQAAAYVPPAQAYSQPFAQPAGFGPLPAWSRVARHLQALSILWLVYAIWRTLSKIAGLTVMHAFLGHHQEFPFNMMGFGLWPLALGSSLLTLALSLLTAYGLSNRLPWGRVIAIISAVFALVHPLTGTLIGIYTLWVLAPAVSGFEYAAIAVPATAPYAPASIPPMPVPPPPAAPTAF